MGSDLLRALATLLSIGLLLPFAPAGAQEPLVVPPPRLGDRATFLHGVLAASGTTPPFALVELISNWSWDVVAPRTDAFGVERVSYRVQVEETCTNDACSRYEDHVDLGRHLVVERAIHANGSFPDPSFPGPGLFRLGGQVEASQYGPFFRARDGFVGRALVPETALVIELPPSLARSPDGVLLLDVLSWTTRPEGALLPVRYTEHGTWLGHEYNYTEVMLFGPSHSFPIRVEWSLEWTPIYIPDGRIDGVDRLLAFEAGTGPALDTTQSPPLARTNDNARRGTWTADGPTEPSGAIYSLADAVRAARASQSTAAFFEAFPDAIVTSAGVDYFLEGPQRATWRIGFLQPGAHDYAIVKVVGTRASPILPVTTEDVSLAYRGRSIRPGPSLDDLPPEGFACYQEAIAQRHFRLARHETHEGPTLRALSAGLFPAGAGVDAFCADAEGVISPEVGLDPERVGVEIAARYPTALVYGTSGATIAAAWERTTNSFGIPEGWSEAPAAVELPGV